jgi:hypothetical protein
LEANKECVLAFHDRLILNSKGEIENDSLLKYKKVRYDNGEMYSIHIPTLSVMFRNCVSSIPVKLDPYLMDCTLFLYLSQFGYFSFLNFCGGVYRAHSGGIYSGSSTITNCNRSISVRQKAFLYLKGINKKELSKSIASWLDLKCNEELKLKLYFMFIRTFIILIFYEVYSCHYDYLNNNSKTFYKLMKNKFKLLLNS